MVANKLYVIFDDGRGEHVVVKPDEIATAVKVLTKEEDTLPQGRRASKLSRASRGVAVEGILLGRISIDFGTSSEMTEIEAHAGVHMADRAHPLMLSLIHI